MISVKIEFIIKYILILIYLKLKIDRKLIFLIKKFIGLNASQSNIEIVMKTNN